jgi:transposase
LKENIADVERLRSSGEMESGAYLARLKQLRSQLAENETALRKAGVPIKVETMTCPHCGGTLPLGQDKCDYCGQVVIS